MYDKTTPAGTKILGILLTAMVHGKEVKNKTDLDDRKMIVISESLVYREPTDYADNNQSIYLDEDYALWIFKEDKWQRAQGQYFDHVMPQAVQSGNLQNPVVVDLTEVKHALNDLKVLNTVDTLHQLGRTILPQADYDAFTQELLKSFPSWKPQKKKAAL